MNLVSDDSRTFSPMFTIGHTVLYGPYKTVIKIGENIPESSEVKFMNLTPHALDADHVTEIRSGPSTTASEKKTPQNYRLKK